MNKCVNCGFQNEAGAAFCTQCGHALGQASASSPAAAPPQSAAPAPTEPTGTPAPPPPVATQATGAPATWQQALAETPSPAPAEHKASSPEYPPQPQWAAPPAAPLPTSGTSSAPPPHKAPKQKKSKAPLLIILSVVLVIALGAGVFFALGGRDILFSGPASALASSGQTAHSRGNVSSYATSVGTGADASLPISLPASAAPEPLDIATALGASEINLYTEDFYTSFLDCVNQKSIAPLRRATPAAKEEVETRLKAPGNQSNLFEYVSCTMVESTRKNYVHEGLPAIEFDANFNYLYSPREGSGTKNSGNNTQTIQLLYVDGEWLVNQFIHHDA